MTEMLIFVAILAAFSVVCFIAMISLHTMSKSALELLGEYMLEATFEGNKTAESTIAKIIAKVDYIRRAIGFQVLFVFLVLVVNIGSAVWLYFDVNDLPLTMKLLSSIGTAGLVVNFFRIRHVHSFIVGFVEHAREQL